MSIRRLMGPEILALLAGLSLPCILQSVHADIIVSDSFSLGGTRTAGGNLAGTTIETDNSGASAKTWKSTAGAVTKFMAGGVIGNNNTAKGVVSARVAIGAPTTIEQVSIVATPGNCDWVGVGFLAADTAVGTPWFANTDTQLWFYVRPTGGWELYANGTSLKLASGSMAGLASDWATTNHILTLQYNPTGSKVNILVDGTSLTNGWVSTSTATISIGAAGFYVNAGGDSKPSTTSVIDSFEVATIPEAASLSLLGVGSFVLTKKR